METSDLQESIEKRNHPFIFIANILTMISSYPSWWAIYRLNHPIGYAGGDGAGLAQGGILVAVWLFSAIISALIAISTFIFAIILKRNTIKKGLLIFTCVCFAYSISYLTYVLYDIFIKVNNIPK